MYITQNQWYYLIVCYYVEKGNYCRNPQNAGFNGKYVCNVLIKQNKWLWIEIEGDIIKTNHVHYAKLFKVVSKLRTQNIDIHLFDQ